MFEYLLEKLKKIDQFGVVFRPSFVDLNPEYRSYIGGIATLLIYGLSFSYFCYSIEQWQANKLLPKITITQTSNEQKEYFAACNISSFYLRKNYGQVQVDPFDPTNLILQPIIYVFKNTQPNNSMSFDFNTKSNKNNYTEVFLNNLQFGLNVYDSEDNPQLDYLLTFGPCLDNYLQKDQKCANESLVEAFMTQPSNIIVVNQYVKEYNAKQKAVSIVARESFTFFSIDSIYYSQNQIKLGETYVDEGILFDSTNRVEFISDIQIITQQLSLNEFSQFLGRPTYLAYQYRLGSIMQTQYIEYPKISEVLADIGSITSLILILSYFFTYINESKLEKQSIAKVIEMYYPEITQIKFTTNWFGKITKMHLNGNLINKKAYFSFYDKLSKIAMKKLSLSNIFYTLSRLQFIIQSNYSIDEIKLAHSIGIKLKQFDRSEQQISHNQSQSNLQVIDIDDTKIHCKESDMHNIELNTIPHITQEQEIHLRVNHNEEIFIKSMGEHHFLNDEDFLLFTIGENHEVHPDTLKMYQYYQQNYIGI